MNTLVFLLFIPGSFSLNSPFYSFFHSGSPNGPLCDSSNSACSCEPIAEPNALFGLARDEDGKVIKMCFDPKDIPSNIIRETLLNPCRINADCREFPNAYCHGQDLNLDIYDEQSDQIVYRGGFCQTDDPELHPLPQNLLQYPDSLEGRLTVARGNCRTHADCVGAGDQENRNLSVNYCNKNTTSGKGVCQLFHVRPNPCGVIHSPSSPFLYCGSQDSLCSGRPQGYCGVGGVCCEAPSSDSSPLECPIGEVYSKKCRYDSDCMDGFCWKKSYEEKESPGWCCKTPYPTICPDTVTDHRLEPQCSSADHCPNGICHYGHCCPTTNYNRTTKKTTNVSRLPYLTNQPCTPSKFQEKPAVRAFCDMETKKYVVIGTENVELEWMGQRCQRNRDCRGFDLVCVRTFENGTCYHNPLKRPIPLKLRIRTLAQILWSLTAFFGILMFTTFITFNIETERTPWQGIKYLMALKLEEMEEEEEDEREPKWRDMKMELSDEEEEEYDLKDLDKLEFSDNGKELERDKLRQFVREVKEKLKMMDKTPEIVKDAELEKIIKQLELEIEREKKRLEFDKDPELKQLQLKLENERKQLELELEQFLKLLNEKLQK